MLRAMGSRYGDDEPGRDVEVTVPFDVAAAPEESIGREARPHPGLRRAMVGVGVLAVIASLIVTVVLPQRRAAEQRHQRVAYDQLLSLSASAEAAVEHAVSSTRDVVQYAEPLLNSSLTTPTVRSQLFRSISVVAQSSRHGIDVERQRLAADKVTAGAGRLKAARTATLTYLSDWSAIFAQAAGGAAVVPNDDVHAQQLAARDALQAAAPDVARAAQASTVLGTDGV